MGLLIKSISQLINFLKLVTSMVVNKIAQNRYISVRNIFNRNRRFKMEDEEELLKIISDSEFTSEELRAFLKDKGKLREKLEEMRIESKGKQRILTTLVK